MSLEQKWSTLTPATRTYYTEVGIFAACQFLDYYTTHMNLLAGAGFEANPLHITNKLLENLGPGGYLAEKGLSVLLVVTAVETIKHLCTKDPNANDNISSIAKLLLIPVNGATAFWCFNNAANLLVRQYFL